MLLNTHVFTIEEGHRSVQKPWSFYWIKVSQLRFLFVFCIYIYIYHIYIYIPYVCIVIFDSCMPLFESKLLSFLLTPVKIRPSNASPG